MSVPYREPETPYVLCNCRPRYHVALVSRPDTALYTWWEDWMPIAAIVALWIGSLLAMDGGQ